MSDRLDLPRPCVSAALLTELAVEHGVGAERILRGTGISPAQLTDPHAETTGRHELALVLNLVNELGADIPWLGIEAGKRYHATTHGIWGFALMSSPTARVVLDLIVKYFELSFSYSRVTAATTPSCVRLIVDDRAVPAEVRGFLIERDLFAMGNIQREVFGAVLPLQTIQITGPEPAHVEMFEQALGIRPTFDAPTTVLTLDATLLDVPLLQANPQVAAQLEQQCADLLQRRRERLGIAGQVRSVLLTNGVTSKLDDVAGQLHISGRTMRRRLAEEHTTYREIVAETTGMIAEELLGAGLTVDDISTRLGYADASSFTYAFKQWKGTTPGRFARSSR